MQEDQRTTWVGSAQRELPPSYEQIAKSNREVKKQQSMKELANLAIEDQQTISGGMRAADRYFTDFEPDPDFKVQDDQFKALRLEFGAEDAGSLIDGADSEGELNHRIAYHREDIKRHSKLASYGMKGVGASVASALLDPVGWGLTIATGGFVGGAAKIGKMSRIAKMATLAAGENVALESVLYAGDSQRDVDNLFIAAGFGGIMGGTIGAVTRGRVSRVKPDGSTVTDDGVDAIVRGADEFDASASKAVREAMEYDAYMAVRERATVRSSVDEDMQILDHISGLQQQGRVRTTASEKGGLKKNLRAVEEKIAEYRQRKIDDTAVLGARTGVPKTKAEKLDFEVARNTLARQYDEPIKDLQRQADELKGKLNASEGAGGARAEAKRFSSLTREQQLKELGLDVRTPPVDMASSVRTALREIKESRKATPTQRLDEAEAKAETTSGVQGDDSLSAARVQGSRIEQEQFDLSDSMEDLMDSLSREAYNSNLAPTKVLGNLSSVSAVILNSKNPVFRGMGLRILENTQGGGYHGKSASILSDVNNNLIRSADMNRYNDGFSQFLKDNNLSKVDFLRPEVARRFNDEIYTAIANGIPANTPAGVKMAAEGAAARLKKALELRKASGEQGFDDVVSSVNYMPTVFDGVKLTSLTNKLGSKDAVIDLLSVGYQTGRYKMGKKAADAVAKVQYLRASDATLSSRVSFNRVVSQEQQAMLVADMRKAGVPDHIIDDFIEGTELSEMATSVSNRAKSSLGINTQATANGVRVQDALNTNVGELVDNYGKEAAGGAAMARMGFKTRQAADNAIDAAERAGRNMAGADSNAISQLRKEADMLRDSVRMIYGQTVDADPTSGIVRGTRRAREITGLLRLQQMGFAQIPEIARTITKMGLGTVLKSVPSTKFLMTRKSRSGARGTGALNDVELREVESLIGYVGEDNWLHGWNVRHDEFGETADNVRRISQVIDNGLAMGSRANTWLSGFKAIQGGSEKITYRSINMRLKEHLSGGRQLRQGDLDEIGLDTATMARLKRHFDDNPQTVKHNGEDVRTMNFEAMEPDLRETVGVAIRRQGGRLIQRNFIGDEGMWMNKWWGKAISQFKSFSIVSLEKQLIHDLKGDKIQAAMIMGWSSLLGLAAYSTQMQLQSLGRADRQEFLDTKFSPENLAFGVFNKLPQVASFGIGGDALATFGLMPDSLMQGTGRLGFKGMGAGELVPAAGVIGDAVGLVNAFGKYAMGDDDVSTRQLVDKVRRLVPLGNAIGTGQILKAGVDMLED